MRGILGPCMDNNDEAFFDAIDKVEIGDGECLNYLELGVCTGMTIHGMANRLMIRRGRNWRAFGVDYHDWDRGFRGKSRDLLGDMLEGVHNTLGEVDTSHKCSSGKVNIYTVGSCAFLQSTRIRPHFIFIDACHSLKCNTADFLLSELILPKGGVLAMHDIDPEYQNTDDKSQIHCGSSVQVLESMQLLGIDAQPGKSCARKGWSVIDRTSSRLEGTHGVIILKKTEGIHPRLAEAQCTE